MGTGIEIALYASLAASAVSTVAQIDASKTAARRQKRAGELKQNTQLGQDRDARVQSSREQRIRRARILQSGENTGSSGSSQESGVLGGMSTIVSQAQGNQSSQKFANIAIGNQMQSAADAASRANTFQAISGLAMQGANTFAGMQAPKKG
tara:strand:- start:8661 stop:9113 length:453 start_codon:yes stop_codon:yes gene_type:complete